MFQAHTDESHCYLFTLIASALTSGSGSIMGALPDVVVEITSC